MYDDSSMVINAIAAVEDTITCAITLLQLVVLVGLDDGALLFASVL
jgi:hypothetical protein